jgi:hypothetical protein
MNDHAARPYMQLCSKGQNDKDLHTTEQQEKQQGHRS